MIHKMVLNGILRAMLVSWRLKGHYGTPLYAPQSYPTARLWQTFFFWCGSAHLFMKKCAEVYTHACTLCTAIINWVRSDLFQGFVQMREYGWPSPIRWKASSARSYGDVGNAFLVKCLWNSTIYLTPSLKPWKKPCLPPPSAHPRASI